MQDQHPKINVKSFARVNTRPNVIRTCICTMCMYNHVKYKTTWMVILTWHCSHNIRPSGGSQLNALISFSGRYGGGRCSYLQQPRYESNTVVPVVAATSKCLAQESHFHSFQQINSHKYISLPPKTSTTRTKMSRLESIARSPRPLHCAAWAHGRSSTKTNAQILPDAAERDVCRSWCGLSNCNSCYNVMPWWCNQQRGKRSKEKRWG